MADGKYNIGIGDYRGKCKANNRFNNSVEIKNKNQLRIWKIASI